MSDARGHLVIRAPNWVGDLVMATPVFAAAAAEPRWERVTLVVHAPLVPVLEDAPFLRGVEVAPVGGEVDEVAALRGLSADAVMLLSNSLGAAWRARRAGIPARGGAALAGRRFLLTHAVVPPTRNGRRVPIPTAHLLRDVAGLFGVLVPDLHPVLGFSDELAEEQWGRLLELGLPPGSGYVLCCPGAAFGAAKLWPPKSFAAALDELYRRTGWPAVVTGGPGEEELVRAVAGGCRHPAISLAGERRDLARLKPLVRGAKLLVVGDSGPRWYAAAFDVPCVSVMGPNFPELTASSLELCEVVRRTDLECAPCLERRCPLGHHRCLRELDPDLVVAAAGRVLELADLYASRGRIHPLGRRPARAGGGAGEHA